MPLTLIRPADPDKPIRITNALEVPLEQAPPDWLIDHMSYVIETGDVEVTEHG